MAVSRPGDLMAAEMAEQPERLAALAGRAGALAERVRGVVPEPLAGVAIAARGSSDHAAAYGRYLIEPAARRPLSFTSPSVFTLYRAELDLRGYLAVGISQSGRTPEIVATLSELRRTGASAVAITNDPESELAAGADAVLDLGVGPERAVPATKTVTAQMVALAVLARGLGATPYSDVELGALPDVVAAALADP